MVRPRNVARSRACAECRKKRIKCDLGQPECQRCLDSNRKCSGPVTDLFIIPTNASAYQSSRAHSPHTNPVDVGKQRITSQQPISAAPQPGQIYEEAMLWRFLSYFTQNAASMVWMCKTPSQLTGSNSQAIQAATRAISLAYAAEILHDSSLGIEASRYYGHCLKHHRQLLQYSSHIQAGKGNNNAQIIPVSVLLSYYEMIVATTPDAWQKHNLAAERLFVDVSPEDLQDSLLNHLYFAVRSNSTVRCVVGGRKSQLLETRWTEVPIQIPCGMGTAVYNNLIDLILWLSEAICPRSPDLNYDSTTLEVTLWDLEDLWVAFCSMIGVSVEDSPLLLSDDDLALTPLGTTEADMPLLAEILMDPGHSLKVAYFHAAAIMLYVLKQRSVAAETDWQHPDFAFSSQMRIDYHARAIMAVVLVLEKAGIGCACLRMMLPAVTIQRFASYDLRVLSETVYKRWTINDGLTGLAAVMKDAKSLCSTPESSTDCYSTSTQLLEAV